MQRLIQAKFKFKKIQEDCFFPPRCIIFLLLRLSPFARDAISTHSFTTELSEILVFLFHADIRYESMINTVLKDLFELLVACVAKPTETISRVGCSCIR